MRRIPLQYPIRTLAPPVERAGADGFEADTEVRQGLRKTEESPKRELILKAMLEDVGARGYEAATLASAIERAGIDPAAVECAFADKEDCYLQAFESRIGRIEDLLVQAAAGEPDWRGKLRSGLAALLEHLEAEADVGRALLVEVHAAGEEALERKARAVGRAAEFIAAAGSETRAEPAPPGIAPEGVVAGMHAVLHARLSSGDGGKLRSLLPDFVYFAVLPYFGADVARAEMAAARPGLGP